MIKRGELQATLVKGRHGMEYRINSGTTLDQAWANPSSSLGKADASLGELIELVRDQQRQLTRLNEERAELFGRLGYFQAQLEAARAQLQVTQDELRVAQTRIVELEAPKEAASEMSNYPVPEQSGQDVGARTVSEMPEDQPEVGRRSEVSAPPATKDQEGSSTRAFKRFWRWLTQPV